MMSFGGETWVYIRVRIGKVWIGYMCVVMSSLM